MSIIQHPQIPKFSKILARNPCVEQRMITESIFLCYKIVKTMIKWLAAFAKMCIYIVVLLEVECKVMIAM